jgi:DNA-binding CsgD family transcriptional regulator
MGAPAASSGIRGEITRLAHAGSSLPVFAARFARVMNRAVPFDGVAIVACDPATTLPTAKWFENSISGDAGSRLTDIELLEPDVNKFRDLAVSGQLAAGMSEATGGNLDRSLRYRELMRPRGFGDELRVACVDGSRTCGVIVMHRELGRPDFGADEVRLLASLSTRLAEAFQRASLRYDVTSDATRRRDGEPGLLLLDDEDRLETANEAAAGWLEELREEGRHLPLVVTAVARGARAVDSGRSDVIASARVRAASGRWALVRGSVLLDGTRKRTAVTVEAARVPELAALIVDAHGLTQRERIVTELVAQGLSTAAIADQLHLSTFTVQDHLKAIFDKLDVASRGELVATLFVDHYLVDGRLSDPRG